LLATIRSDSQQRVYCSSLGGTAIACPRDAPFQNRSRTKKRRSAIASTKSFLAEELSKFCEAAWLDLPAEAAKSLLGAGNEKELRKAGWKAYDAGISLANEVTNVLYANRIVGQLTGRTMDSALRLGQIGGALASAFFGNFWVSVGLPTHSELVAVHDELFALREELAAYAAQLPIAAPQGSIDKGVEDKLRRIWKGSQRTDTRSIKSNAGTLSGSGGKRDVAAQ
jgi:hypothetical protein